MVGRVSVVWRNNMLWRVSGCAVRVVRCVACSECGEESVVCSAVVLYIR